jgi:hypothetical protein
MQPYALAELEVQRGKNSHIQTHACIHIYRHVNVYATRRALTAHWRLAAQGIPSVNRAVVNTTDVDAHKYNLLVEGYGLRAVMATEGTRGAPCPHAPRPVR